MQQFDVQIVASSCFHYSPAFKVLRCYEKIVGYRTNFIKIFKMLLRLVFIFVLTSDCISGVILLIK